LQWFRGGSWGGHTWNSVAAPPPAGVWYLFRHDDGQRRRLSPATEIGHFPRRKHFMAGEHVNISPQSKVEFATRHGLRQLFRVAQAALPAVSPTASRQVLRARTGVNFKRAPYVDPPSAGWQPAIQQAGQPALRAGLAKPKTWQYGQSGPPLLLTPVWIFP